MYSKGDTIKLYGERMAIVLNDGITARKLIARYYGKPILELFKSHGSLLRYAIFDGPYMRERVWYEVLMGDTTGWVGIYKPYSIGDKT